MPDESLGDHVMKRQILDTTAEAAITKVLMDHPELRTAEIPAPLKWAGVIVASLFTMGVGAMAVWLVTSVSSMQVTLARMDERTASQTEKWSDELKEIKDRLSRLEAAQQNEGRGR